MRIIAGIARGMPLVAPRGGDTRPTSDRVREAIFSSLGDRVAVATVLDLFAGTGALGLEAASRGARSVTFVENAHGALKSLKQNLDAFGKGRTISCEWTVIRADVFAQIKKSAAAKSRFSLLFADPPYGETAQTLLQSPELPQLLDAQGLLMLESAKRDSLVISPPFVLVRDGVYGDTRVSFLAVRGN
jgi:16S rRNA (guanine966-N2)-methyltransferase